MIGCRKKKCITIQKIFIGEKKNTFIGCKLLQAVSQLLATQGWINKKLDSFLM